MRYLLLVLNAIPVLFATNPGWLYTALEALVEALTPSRRDASTQLSGLA